MYKDGQGVKQDLAQAKSWHEKAAAQGYAKAKEKLEGRKSM
jgi:TPR repeat protein